MTEAITLPSTAQSVSQARRFVRAALGLVGAAAAGDDAETLVSELATNAVLHAKTSYTIEVSRRGDVVRVRVHDRSVVLPRQRSYGPESTTGRGIRLIATLARNWGIEPDGAAGKAVWFELAADGSSAANTTHDDVDVDALLSAFDDEAAGPSGPTSLAVAA